GFAEMIVDAEVKGGTTAAALGGIVSSGSVQVSATGRNRADAEALMVGVTSIGGGAGPKVAATVAESAAIAALLTSAQNIVSAGSVLVSAREALEAGAGSAAIAIAKGGAGGAISGSGFTADALYQAPVSAELRGTVVAGGAVGATAVSDRVVRAELTA